MAAHARCERDSDIRSITSSLDFLPGAETVPKTPLARPNGAKGDLTLPRTTGPTGQSVSMASGHVRAHQRLSPRCSPRLAQSAFSAQEAAGLTPRGSKHEDSGLWIPARTYEGLSGLGSQRLHKVETAGFRGYVDCEGVGPGCAPNLGGAEDVLSPQVESPREKQVPGTALSSIHVALAKLHRPPRPRCSARAQRATWPPVEASEAPRQSPASRLSGRLQAPRGAPRLRGVRPPSHGVGQDTPLPEVSPSDIVLEERGGLSIPAHSSAVKTEDSALGALGGLAATRQKVLMLREQVGALAAYCDRLEHAAGLADGWHGNGLLPLGPAHTAAMTQAAQQLSIWAAPSQSGTPPANDASRREMASWLADLTKTSSSQSVTSRFGPDEGAGPALRQSTDPFAALSFCDLGELGGYLWPEDLSRFTTPSHSGWAVQTPAC